MNIFADYAQELFDFDLPIIPINGKRAFLKKWQQYCDRLPTQDEIDTWIKKYKNCNIGLCMGSASGLFAFDVDEKDPELQKVILELMPYCAYRRIGDPSKLGTFFFKFTDQVNKQITYNGNPSIDILASRKQCVIPPSIHPETHTEFKWSNKYSPWVDDEMLTEFPMSEILKFETEFNKYKLKKYDRKIKNTGRNDYLKTIVSCCANKMTLDQIVKRVINADKRRHGSNNLFNDLREFATADEVVNASKFVESILNSINEIRKSKGKGELEPGVSSDYQAEGFYKDGKHPQYNDFAVYFKNKYSAISDENTIYIYDGFKYQPISEKKFNNILLNETGCVIKPPHFRNFIVMTESTTYIDELKFNPSGYLNLKNGILKISTGELLEHSPDYKFSYVLEHEFDPNASCPRFTQWLQNATDSAFADLLFYEYLGYIIEGGPQHQQKCLVAIGERDTGKSTLLKIVEDFLGEVNCSSVALDQLGQRFSLIGMQHKLCNIVDEVPARGVDAQLFKRIMSGAMVTMEQKNKPIFSERINAKFLMSANDIINFDSGKSTEALVKRLIYMPFKKQVDNKQENFHLQFKGEYPGILNAALDGLKRLHKYGFTITAENDALNKQFQRENDTVYDFIIENIEPVSNQYERYKIGDVYKVYVTQCREENKRPVGKHEFFKRFERLLPQVHQDSYIIQYRRWKVVCNAKCYSAPRLNIIE